MATFHPDLIITMWCKLFCFTDLNILVSFFYSTESFDLTRNTNTFWSPFRKRLILLSESFFVTPSVSGVTLCLTIYLCILYEFGLYVVCLNLSKWQWHNLHFSLTSLALTGLVCCHHFSLMLYTSQITFNVSRSHAGRFLFYEDLYRLSMDIQLSSLKKMSHEDSKTNILFPYWPNNYKR